MWWARSDKAGIYLGRELALAQTRHGGVSHFRYAAGTGIAATLALLDSIVSTGARLDFHLSGGLCPAVEVTYPPGIDSFRDREIFARAACAGHLGVASEAIKVELDPLHPHLAAAIPVSTWEGIVAWAQKRNLRFSSVQPLWALAARSRRASQVAVLIVEEPDSLTMLGTAAARGSLRAMSLPLNAGDQADTVLQRMHQSLALGVSDACRLRFGPGGQSATPGTPRCWPGWWATL